MLSVQRLALASLDYQQGYLDAFNGKERRPVYNQLHIHSVIDYDNGYDAGHRDAATKEKRNVVNFNRKRKSHASQSQA